MTFGAIRISCLTSLFLIVFFYSTFASAYCKETSCRDIECDRGSDSDCDEYTCQRDQNGCKIEGKELFHSDSCLSFAVEEGSGEGLGIKDSEFEGIIVEAFEEWSKLNCVGGGHPTIHVASAGIVSTRGRFSCEEIPELNIGVWRFSEECSNEAPETPECWGWGPEVYGLASTRFSTDTGEVFDADVDMNAQVIRQEFMLESRRHAVLKVAIHEVGHFLGIAHSNDDRAVMAEFYSQGNLLDRVLTDDDAAAVCTLYPPVTVAPVCGAAEVAEAGLSEDACQRAVEEANSAGCQLSERRNQGTFSWMLFSLAGILVSSHRRYVATKRLYRSARYIIN